MTYYEFKTDQDPTYGLYHDSFWLSRFILIITTIFIIVYCCATMY